MPHKAAFGREEAEDGTGRAEQQLQKMMGRTPFDQKAKFLGFSRDPEK